MENFYGWALMVELFLALTHEVLSQVVVLLLIDLRKLADWVRRMLVLRMEKCSSKLLLLLLVVFRAATTSRSHSFRLDRDLILQENRVLNHPWHWHVVCVVLLLVIQLLSRIHLWTALLLLFYDRWAWFLKSFWLTEAIAVLHVDLNFLTCWLI